MKTLQEVLLFLHQKWKIKVKHFSQSKEKKFEIDKNKYKRTIDFPFDKIRPQEMLSWLDYSSQGWIILSSDLTIKFINKKALSLVRFIKYKDIIGKAINDINELEVLRNKILYSRKKNFPISLDFTIAGEPIWAKIIRGSKKSYLIMLESKLSIESIKKRQNQLINDVSHELKTPLTSLILIGDRLEEVISKKDRYLVKRLKKESKRLRKMVEETLELSKLESSESFNKNKKISISDLVMESWQTLKPLAEKKDIKINLLIPTKYFISADIENLKRAFINILDNAIRYSPANEEIQIEIFKRDSSVVMRVRDKGIGLEENEFNDIFSRFYRGDPSRTKFKKSGSGLGLSITKKIINNNKGFIKAFNHKDGGAIIETIFPCLNTDL
ncbi:sensor histidine kinase [Prochlorococcus marinus]|uniref:sensor histidine kinase n=1 Tax=Prochlorococcus marinus TaxID=1219 RepID=UPI001FD6789A|nr:HAMP domain-containing sensor histidine kinase [Prochlorococcus marinus]MCQ9200867.1 HAMP domain-containing histidine kinase [Prochlorococcus marinus CUG1437]MCQ9203003.1 HAMP domain-containing histidine kinase [Prochlorococcus marinus CUG1436]